MTTTKTFTGHRHTGYVVENEAGAVVATVTESRLRNRPGGYFVRCYSNPDEHTIERVMGLLDARDIAERHGMSVA